MNAKWLEVRPLRIVYGPRDHGATGKPVQRFRQQTSRIEWVRTDRFGAITLQAVDVEPDGQRWVLAVELLDGGGVLRLGVYADQRAATAAVHRLINMLADMVGPASIAWHYALDGEVILRHGPPSAAAVEPAGYERPAMLEGREAEEE